MQANMGQSGDFVGRRLECDALPGRGPRTLRRMIDGPLAFVSKEAEAFPYF